MLTVTLTASDLPTHKNGGKIAGSTPLHAGLDKRCPTTGGVLQVGGGVRHTTRCGGWGTPSLGGAICPPTPFPTPRVRLFSPPMMNSRIPHIDKISMCGAGQGEGRISLNQPKKVWSGTGSAQKGLERTQFSYFAPISPMRKHPKTRNFSPHP